MHIVYPQNFLVSTRPQTRHLLHRVRFIFSLSMMTARVITTKHDDRQGHHYYIRTHLPAKPEYSSDDPGGHHALLASQAAIISGRSIDWISHAISNQCYTYTKQYDEKWLSARPTLALAASTPPIPHIHRFLSPHRTRRIVMPGILHD